MAADTLRHLLSVHATPTNEQERVQVIELCEGVETDTGPTVEFARTDQGYTR